MGYSASQAREDFKASKLIAPHVARIDVQLREAVQAATSDTIQCKVVFPELRDHGAALTAVINHYRRLGWAATDPIKHGDDQSITFMITI